MNIMMNITFVSTVIPGARASALSPLLARSLYSTAQEILSLVNADTMDRIFRGDDLWLHAPLPALCRLVESGPSEPEWSVSCTPDRVPAGALGSGSRGGASYRTCALCLYARGGQAWCPCPLQRHVDVLRLSRTIS